MIGRQIPFGIKLTRQDLDVTRADAVASVCDRLKPTGIISLASYDLRRCEAEPAKAIESNVVSVSHLSKEARRRDIPIIIVSTAAIFNGPFEASFDEDAVPCPLHLYGQTKWLAEMSARLTTPKHLVLRTGWLFGGTPAHSTPFVDAAAEKAKRGEPIKASTDQRGSPTYLADFIETMRDLISQERWGIHHVVNDGAAVGADLASAIVAFFRSSSSVEMFRAADIPNAGPRRSASEVLVSTRLTLRPWREALHEFLCEKKE